MCMTYSDLLFPGVRQGVDTVDLYIEGGEVEGPPHPMQGLLHIHLLLDDLCVRTLQHIYFI